MRKSPKRFCILTNVLIGERKDRKENEGNGSKQEIGNKKLNVLYLGRRHPLKGVEYLEAAVRQLQNSTRSTRSTRLNIELRIVSDAKGEELEKVWEWCDVLVLPTLSENFGLVVAEALERGKRVITTDGAPAWEDGNDYGVRLVYLRRYVEAPNREKVRLLNEALQKFFQER